MGYIMFIVDLIGNLHKYVNSITLMSPSFALINLSKARGILTPSRHVFIET